MPEPTLEFIGRKLQDIQTEQRLQRMRFDTLEVRFSSFDSRFGAIEERMASIETSSTPLSRNWRRDHS